MNRSQSKIRHIQQSNVLLEQRKFGLLNEDNDNQSWLDQQKYLDDAWKNRGKEESEKGRIENEKQKEEAEKNQMSGLLQNVRLNSYLVPDSVKKIYSDDSGIEYEMKLAIYKNSHSFPEEMSSELEKKTKDIDELTNYLTEKIENSNLLNYSNNGPNKPYHKTTIEYIGEEGSDYVFLIKMKSGYE
jgi:hypothetical protein